MKNLKQVLALGMAFSLTMSTMAGAAFTDQADIKATEAVDMLNALGVIKGYEDGSFKPEGTVTRAEAAKMIFTIRNGGNDDASAFAGLQTSFTDLAGYGWAEGYIKYCQANGIIAGKSATSFDPGAQVTGVELAKMMLVTMGYDATKAGLTGATWSTNTLSLSSEAGLLDDVASDLAAGLPRQYAAQMMYNTLTAPTVRWSTDGNSYTDMGTNNQPNESVGSKYMNLCINVGTLTGVDGGTLSQTVVGPNNYDDNGDTPSYTKVTTDYSDLLGQSVKVMFKNGKYDQVIGIYATGDNTVYTVNASELEADGSDIKFGGKSYKVEGDVNGLVTYIDGNAQSGTSKYTVAELDNMNTSTSVMTLIDSDANGKIDTVVEKTQTVAKVTYVSKDQIVAGNVTYKYSDSTIPEGIAKNDWVIVTDNDDLFAQKKELVKADVVEAKIEGYKGNSGTAADPAQYKINGTWYNSAVNGAFSGVSAGDTVKAVMVNGILCDAEKVSGTAATMNIAVVVETGSFNQAKLAFADGTVKTVTISTDGDAAVDGQAFLYEVDGEEYKLDSTLGNFDNDDYTYLSTGAIKEAGSSDVGTSTPSYADNVDGVKIADDAKVVLYTDSNGATAGGVKSSKVITGKQFKTINWQPLSNDSSTALAALTSKVAGIEKVSVLFVNIGDAMPGSFQTKDNYAYVVSSSYDSGDGYFAYSIFDGENTTEVKEKTGTARNVGDIIGYSSITEDGEIKDVTRFTTQGTDYQVVPIRGVDADGKGLTVDGINHLKITDSTKVILVNSNDGGKQVGVPGNTISEDYLADEIGDTGVYYDNAKIIVDGGIGDGNDVLVLVVDVVNNIMADDATPIITESTELAASTGDASVKSSADGVYIPVDATFQAGVSAPFNELRILKFTGVGSQTYKLSIKDSNGAEVYTETSESLSAGGHYFYIRTVGTKDTVVGGVLAAGLTAGNTYAFTITGADGAVYMNGSFTA